ncbi:MAG: hypothetical protein QMD65_02210 [Patescibacteria group bacterium]|nr:hypothetical protein [Patescibacteria group bacterium]
MSIIIQVLKPFFFVLSAIFVVADIALIIGIFSTIRKILLLKPNFGSLPKSEKRTPLLKDEKLKKKWVDTMIKANISPPNSYIIAIIEADKIMDEVLQRLGLKGAHTADRLEALVSWDLKSVDNLWHVHRIRNEIVHTPGFNLSHQDAKEVLDGYELFLKEVGVL